MRNLRFAVSLTLLCAVPSALAAPRIIEIQAPGEAQSAVQDSHVPVQARPPAQLAQSVPEKEPGPEESPAQAQAPAQTQPPAQAPAGALVAPAAPQPPAPAPGGTHEPAVKEAAPANQAAPATAQAQPPKDAWVKDARRFSFRRVDDGILRLDSASGHMAFCSSHTVGWTCQAVPEDRAALEKEIGRLQGEVSDLKSRLADLQAEIATLRATPSPPPPRPPAEVKPPERTAPPADQGGSLKMPSEADMARARAAIVDAWQRVLDMIGNLQRDMTPKPPPPDGTTL
jgi:hypothetical protein